MFSVKKNVLQTVALLKAYGVKHVVLSPGSRNAPLIETFSQEPFFQCHTIVDERNAAFYALGIIQRLQEPVAICCTSGSALQNYAPAVSEAFYQQLPLIIVSADRAPAWIGQMDGQTLPQAGIFGSLVKKSVNLPEVHNKTDEWYCNRLINEALMACTAQNPGPVQINVPLSEPLFDYSETQLPTVRRIQCVSNDNSALTEESIDALAQLWANASKRMIIVGQSFQTPKLIALLEQLVQKTGCIVLCEHLSNCTSPYFFGRFDALLQSIALTQENQTSITQCEANFAPELLITLGGHIVSKRIKKFLRDHTPQNHWHVSLSSDVVDLYQSLTHLITADATSFLSQLTITLEAQEQKQEKQPQTFYAQWQAAVSRIPPPLPDIAFSDLWAVGAFLQALPENAVLQMANSSAVRAIQLYPLKPSVQVYCNRGINGIEGSLPTAVGFAAVHQGNVYLVIGDLSFFYSLSALWNIEHIKNLRILLINNGGGGIFHQLPGLNKSASLNEYVAAQHHTSGQPWGKAAGFECLKATNREEFADHLKTFTSDKIKHHLLLEICTDTDANQNAYQQYNQQLKEII